MSSGDKFQTSAEAWEAAQEFMRQQRRAGTEDEYALDESTDMQMISTRLQKKLIENLKVIAKHNGIGYQTLIRAVLTRFVVSEFKRMMNDVIAQSGPASDKGQASAQLRTQQSGKAKKAA